MHTAGQLSSAEFEAAKMRTLRMDRLDSGSAAGSHYAPPPQMADETLLPVLHTMSLSRLLEHSGGYDAQVRGDGGEFAEPRPESGPAPEPEPEPEPEAETEPEPEAEPEGEREVIIEL